MVNRQITNQFEIDEEQIEQQISEALGSADQEGIMAVIDETVKNFEPGSILTGTIVNYIGDDVVIEVGLKSEGSVSSSEFDDRSDIKIGSTVEVLLEAVESDSGLVLLSKRKADRIRGWERVVANYKEGDTIKGKATRRIKGGLLVDVGVPVFLPASQVDIRRPGDISEYIGREIEAKILKIDEERRNIVISRRKLLEETRAEAKSSLLVDLEVGQLRKGVVKNIADFGVFVDLGGIDGLLHITDMSWGRVGHPSELVKLDQDIEVKILSIDHEREKIALGLKQKTASPWTRAEKEYIVGSIVKGIVVNIMSYGAFIKLEEGVEGLVHISEMSWTKRISHPSEMLSIGQEIDVWVLEVNPAKQEISLGIKQLAENPWTMVARKYPPSTIVDGKVRNLTNYGAFIEIEEGIDGLLHVSDMSWTKKVNHPGEVLKKGEDIKCIVLSVDQDKQRVALGLKQMAEDPWLRAIPDKYIAGQIVKGTVTKLTNFGVFVQLEPQLEGLLHISELSDQKVEGPQDIVNVGDELEVKILRVDTDDRKIGLSLKRAQWAAEDDAAGGADGLPQRGGLDDASHLGTNIIDATRFHRTVEPEAPAEAEVAVESAEEKTEPQAVSDADTQETAEVATEETTEGTAEAASDTDTPETAEVTTGETTEGTAEAASDTDAPETPEETIEAAGETIPETTSDDSPSEASEPTSAPSGEETEDKSSSESS